MTVYNTKADVLVNADNPGLMKIQNVYPILKKSIYTLQKEYNLNYVLFRESFANLKDVKLQKAAIEHKVGDIILIRLKKNASET
jgi:hypothetical protein